MPSVCVPLWSRTSSLPPERGSWALPSDPWSGLCLATLVLLHGSPVSPHQPSLASFNAHPSSGFFKDWGVASGPGPMGKTSPLVAGSGTPAQPGEGSGRAQRAILPRAERSGPRTPRATACWSFCQPKDSPGVSGGTWVLPGNPNSAGTGAFCGYLSLLAAGCLGPAPLENAVLYQPIGPHQAAVCSGLGLALLRRGVR